MTDVSLHTGIRRLLEAIADSDTTTAMIDRIGCDHGWWQPGHRWKRTWSRITDPAAGYVTMTFEAANTGGRLGCTVEVGPADISSDGLTASRVRPFPEDPMLPALATALARFDDAIVKRYRPSRRCTMRLPESEHRPEQYLKVFPDSRAVRLHAECRHLHHLAQAGHLGFAVATPGELWQDIDAFSQLIVDGEPVSPLLRSDCGPALSRAMGAAAATLTKAPLQPESAHTVEDELRRFLRRRCVVATVAPSAEGRLAELEFRLRRAHDALPTRPLRPIHGSPHPSQWLVHQGQLGLVDFDRLCLGDPEFDVATFAGEVDFERWDTRDDVIAGFMSGYEDEFGPLDKQRMALYRTHKRFAKVYRTATSARVDADRRLIEHLDRTLECLPEVRR